MPSLSSPWFHQTGNVPDIHSHSAIRSAGAGSNMSEAEMLELNKRLLRPTTSSNAKKSKAWKLENTFMEQGRHSWSKMELFEDCKKCVWTNGGSIKHSCKTRPTEKKLAGERAPSLWCRHVLVFLLLLMLLLIHVYSSSYKICCVFTVH